MEDTIEQAKENKVSKWLDKKVEEKIDVSQILLPADLLYDEVPDETIFFREINPDGMISAADHPFSTVERYGNWYYSRGRDSINGSSKPGKEWHFFTKDKDIAFKTAKSHIE
jgi:hypothetical protein